MLWKSHVVSLWEERVVPSMRVWTTCTRTSTPPRIRDPKVMNSDHVLIFWHDGLQAQRAYSQCGLLSISKVPVLQSNVSTILVKWKDTQSIGWGSVNLAYSMTDCRKPSFGWQVHSFLEPGKVWEMIHVLWVNPQLVSSFFSRARRSTEDDRGPLGRGHRPCSNQLMHTLRLQINVETPIQMVDLDGVKPTSWNRQGVFS